MQQRKGKRGWRSVRRIGLGLLVMIVMLAAAGASWNALAIRHYRNANPPPGKLYTVNGHLMHLYCSGEGSPTIVLESGLGEDFTVWAKVQPGLSGTTRTCSYDRAGFGWSEAQSGPRDSDSIADQLHALLMQAGITDPVVLMGHSAGGLHIRAYATRFPQDVAGLVFVDASSPLQNYRLPQAVQALDRHSAGEFLLLKSLVALGVARLTGQCTVVPPGFEAYAGWLKANTCVLSQITSYQREAAGLSASLSEVARTGPYGNLPILIFSRDAQLPMPAHLPVPVSVEDWRKGMASWDAMQEELRQLSTDSRRIVAKGSGHYIHFDRPDVLNREVPLFIRQIRAHVPSSESGSTAIE
jgi:Predicted hydrolases or acyltransferases (alpha/beta hydrolase superfamily)